MFTSIKLLRSSHAMQSRVTQVENFLKKKYGTAYDATMAFPTFEVWLANSADDYHWVGNNCSVEVIVPKLTAACQSKKSEICALIGRKTKAEAGPLLVTLFLKIWAEAKMSPTAMLPWFKANGAAVEPSSAAEVVGTASAVVLEDNDRTPAMEGSTATVAVAKTPGQGRAPAATTTEAPEAVEVKHDLAAHLVERSGVFGQTVSPTMLERIIKLEQLGTSKDKRSQILEALGVELGPILHSMAKAGLLKAGVADELLKRGVK